MRPLLRRARNRLVLFLALACALLGLADLELFHLQVMRARDPSDSSIWRPARVVEEGRRADIVDCRGGVLATSVREVDLRAYTRGIVKVGSRDYPRELADRLAKLCGVDPATTLANLANEKCDWLLLARGIRDPGVIADLRKLTGKPGFRALSLETRFVRDYPRGALLAPLIGWTGWQRAIDNPDGLTAGVAGIEALCDVALTAVRGERLVERDGLKSDMLDPDLPASAARDGRAVQLTIEPIAQEIVETAIDAGVTEFSPDWAEILVLDPRTSEVIAIAQRPTPRAPLPALLPTPAPHSKPSAADRAASAAVTATNQAELARHQFLAVHRVYPPGSSFKPFMLGLVLGEKKATPDTLIDCENGAAQFGSRVIHDTHPKGLLTATQVLVESSNIGMSKLALSLVPGDSKRGSLAFQPVLDHLARLGFGSRICALPGEENGMVPPLKSMDRNYTLASLSFGQQIQVTALQMAAACVAVANGGTWRAPRFVRAIEGESGAWTAVPPPDGEGRKAFSAGTAAELRRMLACVVEDGATKRWKPVGWSMAGKTGTAQDERHREISISSYWCFAPVHDPRFLVLTVLHDPKHGRFAADNAAKVAGHVMGELLTRFNVPQDRREEVAATTTAIATPATGSTRFADLALADPRSEVVASPVVGEGR